MFVRLRFQAGEGADASPWRRKYLLLRHALQRHLGRNGGPGGQRSGSSYRTVQLQRQADRWHYKHSQAQACGKPGRIKHIPLIIWAAMLLRLLIQSMWVTMQVECHPYLCQADLLSYCRSVMMPFDVLFERKSPSWALKVLSSNSWPQVSGCLCDGLQSSGKRGPTLGLSWWAQPLAGPTTGEHRSKIPEDSSSGHSQVGQRFCVLKEGEGSWKFFLFI